MYRLPLVGLFDRPRIESAKKNCHGHVLEIHTDRRLALVVAISIAPVTAVAQHFRYVKWLPKLARKIVVG
jgi:hypothetical protein